MGEQPSDETGGQTTRSIWEDFGIPLRRFIRKRVQDEDAVNDILQDVFFKIHDKIGHLKDINSLQGWLYQITRNTIIDHYRYCGTEADLLELQDDLIDESHDGSDGVADELTPCVKALMDRLPRRYREPLLLTEFQGLTQKEMGKKLGLSLSGAKSRVQRGREKLRELLSDCCHFEFDPDGNIEEYRPKSPDSPECCRKPNSE